MSLHSGPPYAVLVTFILSTRTMNALRLAQKKVMKAMKESNCKPLMLALMLLCILHMRQILGLCVMSYV